MTSPIWPRVVTALMDAPLSRRALAEHLNVPYSAACNCVKTLHVNGLAYITRWERPAGKIQRWTPIFYLQTTSGEKPDAVKPR